MKRFTVVALIVAVLVVVVMVLAPSAFAKRNANPRVIPPSALVQGLTYGDWGAEWWQWALAIPAATNPLADPTGAMIASGQSGSVWFLCGTVAMTQTSDFTYEGVADRTATIPHGKILFFPIVNTECSTAEGNGTTVAELAALADFFTTHTTSLTCTVDGKELKNLFAYRGTSGGYLLWWPDDAVLPLPHLDSPTLSVSDGYWIMLTPLPSGKHTLHWTGKQEFSEAAGDGFNGIFTQDITYHLTVK